MMASGSQPNDIPLLRPTSPQNNDNFQQDSEGWLYLLYQLPKIISFFCLIGFSHSKEWAFQPSQPSFNSRVKSHFLFAILFYFLKLTQNNTEMFRL